MKTQIIGVLGLGIFGQTIATELSTFGQDVIALDNNPKTIDSLADQVTKAAVGDITDIDFLCSTGIESCDTVIIATGEHLELRRGSLWYGSQPRHYTRTQYGKRTGFQHTPL